MPHLGIPRAANPIAFFMDSNSNTPSDNPGNNLIKQFIINKYQPARDFVHAKVKLSTSQLHFRLLVMFPDADMTAADLYVFLRDQEYIEYQVRPFVTEWLFDEKV